MTDHMNSFERSGSSRRQRLVSATYEGVGARWKGRLRDVSLAVYDECPQMEEIARKVAIHNRVASVSSFFMMDASRVEGSLQEWGRCLPDCAPFYSLACNDDPLLLELLTRRNQCNLQVSTLAELECALTVVAPSRILFHSHLLTKKMLRIITNLPEPLHALVIDSEDVAMAAAELNPYQPLIIRVSLSPDSDRVDLSMGMPVEEVIESVPRLVRCGIPVVGVSVQFMAEGVDMVQRGHELVRLLSALSPLGLATLDVGDGLELATLFESSFVLDCIVETANAAHMKMMATPGRFFAASAFSLVTSIVGKRSIDARAITRNDEDWGREGFVYETSQSVYGVFSDGLLGGARPRCQPLPLYEESDTGDAVQQHDSAVMGSARDSIDFPQRHARLPSLAIGDCLLWREMGAYASRDDDAFPVYYYTGKAHWERLQEGEKELLSDGGSDLDSEDEDDLTQCFGRVFN